MKKKAEFTGSMFVDEHYVILNLNSEELPNKMFFDIKEGDLWYGVPGMGNTVKCYDAKYGAIFMYNMFSCREASEYISLLFEYLMLKMK